ncbi:FHA domain-containing protein [Vitiosangium sp. GDMCC 1.1324]|uniref:FHA domain-containing protein n=1 Tax=Vitiosangium sp. (strain GDMCC 1.1324) TaxID=2138576 RepID=UPI000D3CF94C|nr:FHA domain-containing protein [Vitiosangium sp. GDMCC 1.1324]PTL81365.1 FHA domain-containing protein [Vitiosangium sp. GDMCC 1.1324]
MHLKFSVLASQFLDDPQSVRRAVCWPVLVWEAPPMGVRPLFTRSTLTGLSLHRPTVAEPLVLEVRKRPQGVIPPPGIRLGRTPDNDVVVEDPTVSRVHATFTEEKHTRVWYVADSGSHNGTWHNGTLLIPGRPTPLFDRASLRFGDMLATFLQFSAFNEFILDWLARHSRGSRTHVGEGGLTRGG